MKNSQGFTLIQTILSVAILGMLGMGVLQLVNFSINVTKKQAHILNLKSFENQADTFVSNSSLCTTMLLNTKMPLENNEKPIPLNLELFDPQGLGSVAITKLQIDEVSLLGDAGSVYKKAHLIFDIANRNDKNNPLYHRSLKYPFYFQVNANNKLTRCFAPDDPEILEEELKLEIVNEDEAKQAISKKMCLLFGGDWVSEACNDVKTPEIIKEEAEEKFERGVSHVEVARGHCRTESPEFIIEGWIERHDPTPEDTSNADHRWVHKTYLKDKRRNRTCTTSWDAKTSDKNMFKNDSGCDVDDPCQPGEENCSADYSARITISEESRETEMIALHDKHATQSKGESALIACRSKIDPSINFTNPGEEVLVMEASCSRNDSAHSISAEFELHDPTPDNTTNEDHYYIARVSGQDHKTKRKCTTDWRTKASDKSAYKGINDCTYDVDAVMHVEVLSTEEARATKMQAIIYHNDDSFNKRDEAIMSCTKYLAKKGDLLSRKAACSKQGGSYTDGKCQGINKYKEVGYCKKTEGEFIIEAWLELHDPTPEDKANKDHYYLAKVKGHNTTKNTKCESNWTKKGSESNSRTRVSDCSLNYPYSSDYDNVDVRIDDDSIRPSKMEVVLYGDGKSRAIEDAKIHCTAPLIPQ